MPKTAEGAFAWTNSFPVNCAERACARVQAKSYAREADLQIYLMRPPIGAIPKVAWGDALDIEWPFKFMGSGVR